jgi:hypothetical protein
VRAIADRYGRSWDGYRDASIKVGSRHAWGAPKGRTTEKFLVYPTTPHVVRPLWLTRGLWVIPPRLSCVINKADVVINHNPPPCVNYARAFCGTTSGACRRR